MADPPDFVTIYTSQSRSASSPKCRFSRFWARSRSDDEPFMLHCDDEPFMLHCDDDIVA